MANPTTNFGWVMPAAVNLVTDLPADFDVFGQAVDTDFVGLKGGTTGQVLAKASATDLDFVWSADAAGMTNPMTTTGDVIYSSSGSTPARLGIGTDGQVLTSDGSVVNWETPSADIPLSTVTTNGDVIYATGSGAVTRLGIGSTSDVLTVAGGVPTWAAPAAGGGKVLQVVAGYTTTLTSNSTTTFADTTLSATITPTSATSTILVLVSQNGCNKSADNSNNALTLRLLRGASTLITFTGTTFLYTATAIRNNATASVGYLDSPATTSATTYKTQLANRNASASVGVQNDSETSSMILLEIGA
jgi:hypothetical protein